jgi:carbonic anhydrase
MTFTQFSKVRIKIQVNTWSLAPFEGFMSIAFVVIYPDDSCQCFIFMLQVVLTKNKMRVMKNSSWMTLLFFLLLSACNTNQQNEIRQTDSLGLKQKDSAEQRALQSLAKAGDMVKSESPDALVEFEQGYALPRLNDGIRQSPVNIITSSIETGNIKPAGLRFTGSIDAIENLGHTIQIDFAEGSTTRAAEKSYALKQLHFHTPSEHLIDGMTFPMEMHIVSRLKDSISAGESEYTVLGILFKMGRENKFLKEFINAIPQKAGKNGLDSSKVKLGDLFTDFSNSGKFKYYKYHGSLTTPPFTESVNWVIAKQIFEASEQQIATIEKLEGNNARHVCALNNRKIKIE